MWPEVPKHARRTSATLGNENGQPCPPDIVRALVVVVVAGRVRGRVRWAQLHVSRRAPWSRRLFAVHGINEGYGAYPNPHIEVRR